MASKTTLNVQDVRLDELEPHPANPRRGNVAAIAESLQVNGQFRPIVVARGVVIAGNHTFHAANTLGWEKVAAVVLDIDPEGPEATRIMLADNRTADLGTYDDAELLDLLEALSDDLTGTGYLDDDLADLKHLAGLHEITAGGDGAGYSGTGLEVDGVIPDKDFQQLADNYASKAVRSIILPYGLEDYEAATRLLGIARAETGAESNADAVLAILRRLDG